MTEEKALSPPYVGYGSFQAFITGLKGNPLPDRIDRSVFGSMSGGLAYGLLSALKFLHLISANGTPRELLVALTEAEDEEATKAALCQMLKGAYPGLFNGTVKLDRATSAQLDEHLRSSFGITGSTVDKAASFVLAVATAAGIDLSNQLKTRKPVAGSTPRKLKLKKANSKEVTGISIRKPAADLDQRSTPKDPVRMLVDIIDMSIMNDEEQQAVWTLIRFLKRQESQKKVMEEVV